MRAFIVLVVASLGAGLVPFEVTRAEPQSSSSQAYFEIRDWQAQGRTINQPADGPSVACDKTGRHCVCLEPLPCGNGQSCASFEENLAVFRAALNSKQPGRHLVCRRAETGRCGDFRYFHFDGDIDRNETRWFDASGQVVAQRNRSDFPAYCGQRTELRLMGKLPRCGEMEITELICGSRKSPMPIAPQRWISGSASPLPVRPPRDDRPPVP